MQPYITEALFTTANIGKPPRFPSKDEIIKKKWCIYKVWQSGFTVVHREDNTMITK